MKKPISNTEWANKQNQKLLFAIISILVLCLLLFTEILVQDAIATGTLKIVLKSIFLLCISWSIIIFIATFTIHAIVENRKYHKGIVVTFFNTLIIGIYSNMIKILGIYIYKKLSVFFDDLIRKNAQQLNLRGEDIKLCTSGNTKWMYKKGHLIYRVSLHIISPNFRFNKRVERIIRSMLIKELRTYGIDGLFSSYVDNRHNTFDSIHLLHMIWDRKNSILTFELLFIQSEHDAEYVRYLRDKELQTCNLKYF